MYIRPVQSIDLDDLFSLYRQQMIDLPFHHEVSRDQFRQDLRTTRFLRNPAAHHADARIALVAVKKDRVFACVSGGMVVEGDEVVESGTGYIQSMLGTPADKDVLQELILRVVDHVNRYRPNKIVAQDGCLSPVFFADSASTLSSRHAWIGQLLLDSGFKVCAHSMRMVASLEAPREEMELPHGLQVLHLKHEMDGFDPTYDFGCLLLKSPYEQDDGVAWCGNFYSGAFVTGASFRSIYINWLKIIDAAHFGKGLGRLLLRHSLVQAQQRGAKFASLLTQDDNFVARNLYQSEGFVCVDVTHSFEFFGRKEASNLTA